jgi:hypothetical protein
MPSTWPSFAKVTKDYELKEIPHRITINKPSIFSKISFEVKLCLYIIPKFLWTKHISWCSFIEVHSAKTSKYRPKTLTKKDKAQIHHAETNEKFIISCGIHWIGGIRHVHTGLLFFLIIFIHLIKIHITNFQNHPQRYVKLVSYLF